jgi:3-dehydroquinate dehydratase-1
MDKKNLSHPLALPPSLPTGIWPPASGPKRFSASDLKSIPGLLKAQVLEYRGDLLPEGTATPASQVIDEACKVGKAWKALNPQGRFIFTLRLKRDGGRWPDEKALDRCEIWEQWIKKGPAHFFPDWLDIEIETFHEWSKDSIQAWRKMGTRFLVSHHQFQQTYGEDELDSLWMEFKMSDADGLKWALQPGTRKEYGQLGPYLAMASHAYALSGIFCLGEAGKPSRLASVSMGCGLTYGYLGDEPAAPGQLSVEELVEGLEKMKPKPSKSHLQKNWLDWWDTAESVIQAMKKDG